MNQTVTEQRSTFITVLAWIFIVLAGFGTLITAVQNIMIRMMFSMPEVEMAINENQDREQAAPVIEFMLRHFDLIFVAAFIASLLCFISSVGLLRRKNWARLVFIGLLSLAILWNLGWLIFQQYVFWGIPVEPEASMEVQAQMDTMFMLMAILSVIFALGFCALFGWIIWKLCTPRIAGEFKHQP